MPLNDKDLNINCFIAEIIKPYIYEQYKNIEGLEGFYKIICDYIQQNYFNALQYLWSQRDILRSLHPYLTFYARYYLGIIRPIDVDIGDVDTEIAADTIKNIYDTNIPYDTRFKYDDFYESQPQIGGVAFLSFLSFILDYSQLTWTHDYIMMYAAEQTLTEPIDVKLRFEPNKVIYYVLGTSRSRDFISSHHADEYQMNMPICRSYEFQLGDHWRASENKNEIMLGYLRPTDWPENPTS